MQLFDKTRKYVGSMYVLVGWNSIISIVIRYRLDGPGIESWCGRGFLHMFRPVLWPAKPRAHWVQGLFPWGKVAGEWR